MGKEIMFGNTEIKKHKFYSYKNPTFLKDKDIDKILISTKTFSGEKNCKSFKDYLDYYVPLHNCLIRAIRLILNFVRSQSC